MGDLKEENQSYKLKGVLFHLPGRQEPEPELPTSCRRPGTAGISWVVCFWILPSEEREAWQIKGMPAASKWNIDNIWALLSIQGLESSLSSHCDYPKTSP
jgi:hypothetical protein